jgi:AcrR family transcriptional regulator
MKKATKSPPRERTSKSPGSRHERLGPEAWVGAARDVLIQHGVARVKVEPIATLLGVTTGSFYWHFRNRQQLLDALLSDWETNNSLPMFEAVAKAGADPDRQLLSLVNVWLEENDYSPAYDSAVRDWARTSTAVERTVRRVDERRIELLHAIFIGLGDPEPDALVRARITYFHQVGYYALRLHEDPKDRLKLFPVYLALLKGEQRRVASRARQLR